MGSQNQALLARVLSSPPHRENVALSPESRCSFAAGARCFRRRADTRCVQLNVTLRGSAAGDSEETAHQTRCMGSGRAGAAGTGAHLAQRSEVRDGARGGREHTQAVSSGRSASDGPEDSSHLGGQSWLWRGCLPPAAWGQCWQAKALPCARSGRGGIPLSGRLSSLLGCGKPLGRSVLWRRPQPTTQSAITRWRFPQPGSGSGIHLAAPLPLSRAASDRGFHPTAQRGDAGVLLYPIS